jgi:ATP-dependent DNA helicase DinG
VRAAEGAPRDQQRELCVAIAEALHDRHHLVAEAPTGVGKSFAFTAAAVAHLAARQAEARRGPEPEPDFDPAPDERPRVVIATATKALQDQLVDLDLPRVVGAAGELGMAARFAVLKGRSNYLCLAAVDDAAGSLFDDEREAAGDLAQAARDQGDGDRSRLPHVEDRIWAELSVTPGECPGARDCTRGTECWAERARAAAADADVVVVNQSLYAAHLLADEAVLPTHDAVVVDEAHALADNIVDAGAVALTAARLDRLARRGKTWLDDATSLQLERATRQLAGALSGADGDAPDLTDGDLAVSVASARQAVADSVAQLKEESGDAAARALQYALTLQGELAALRPGGDDRVAWVERGTRLVSSDVEATAIGRDLLWPGRTVIATSATLKGGSVPAFGTVLGALGAPDGVRTLAVPTPFDHRRQALLYVPKGRMPSPKHDGWREAVRRELWELVGAAGGRTLALFTSRAAAQETADWMRARAATQERHLDIVTQWDGARDEVVGRLLASPSTVVCATRSFWSGVDIPGDACVLVAIDRLPFPRPDDPLARARRQRATARRQSAFVAVDLPYAGMHLAQGVGRLIRSSDDRGVVAVLDTRLATASWRQQILDALPPMRRTVDLHEVQRFLHDVAADAVG